ncbi:MAG: hypothetical protein ACT4PI_12635 [Actinomycetota bacterium]
MGDEKGTKKKQKKPKPPKLPGKPPPKDDKAATDKYNEATKFLDCTGTKVVLKAGKLDWIDFGWITPEATFEADKAKPGTINIKVKLPTGDISLPATVKDGKLDVDTKDLPIGKDKVKEFVDGLNAWFEANGKQLDGPAVKDGELTLTKSAAAAPGKAGEKKEEKGVKGGLFPHVPGREKVAAGTLLGLSVLFGVGFMNAGDETETRTEKVCPERSGPGESVRLGLECEQPRASDEPAPAPRAEGLAEQIGDVVINREGGQPSPGTITQREGDRFSFEVPLFAMVPHQVNLGGVDGFTLPVPAASGPVPPITTQQGGTAECDIDHTRQVGTGLSGGFCVYIQPIVQTIPQPTPVPDGGTAVEPVVTESKETKDGAPVSVAAIPGAVALAGGALYARNTCRGEKKGDGYGGDYVEPDFDTKVEQPDFPPAVFGPSGDDKPTQDVM